MISTRIKWYVLGIQLVLLSACGPQASPPTEAPADPAAIPVDLAGPEMKVGSSFLYADGSLLVAVPGGPFIMGADGPDNPQHQVNLSDFWIYSTKVTNGQYAYCVAMGVCEVPLQTDNPAFNDPLHVSDPMVGVDYNDAATYCGFVHGRLPTEAEWEKAARGPNGNIYPWGDGAPNCDLLNYDICVGNTTPVNTYPAGRSYYDALDMEGNTLEWVADFYQADYYLTAPTDNPPGPDKGPNRSVRSSAFNSGGNQTQVYNRFQSRPDTHRNNLGFRCVVDEPTYFAPFCDYPATYGTDGIGGAAGGAQPEVFCPELTINQNMQCNGTTPITYVTFGGSDVHFQPSCDPDPAVPGQYACAQDGKLTVCSYCKVQLTGDPLCPSGYTYDSETKTCVGRTVSAGACLPGFTLGTRSLRRLLPAVTATPDAPAAADQCCAYTPPEVSDTLIRTNSNLICDSESSGSVRRLISCHPPFPSCPAGTSFDGQECISTVLQPFCKIEGVSFNSCTGGDGGSTPVCPGVTCGINYVLNPNTCQCMCNGC